MTKENILKELTLEEKMLMLTQGVKQRIYDQTYEVERLGLGAKYMYDGPHGLRNKNENCLSIPNLCALASSWDVDALYKTGEALAEDCIHYGVDMLLGPGANIKRHILCGRNFEYMSEDPVLSGEMAAGYINGLQSKGVSACLKHYAMNNQELHREYASFDADERVMREIYLKSFEIAVKKSQPVAVMCSYNKVYGVWCSENPLLLRDIMKNEWGYKGIIMSDWGAVHDIGKALRAGLDMQMPRNRNIVQQLTAALEQGVITEGRIDEALSRVLDFITLPAPEKTERNREKLHLTARSLASSGMVLLKNKDNTLPISADKYKKITVVGEYAKSPVICGQGSAEVYPAPDFIDSPYEELKKILADSIEIDYYEGYKKGSFSPEMLWPTVSAFAEHIRNSDAVVFFVGVSESEDTEKYDRRSPYLNPNFELFINKAYALGKKVIAVIQSGSAVIFEDWRKKTHAVIQMWLAGEGAGGGIADILTGRVNPCGKLAETFPLKMRQDLEYEGDGLKIVYKEGFDVGYRYYDKHPEEICYPFGHGLSYTDFEYSDLKTTICGDKIKITLDLKNAGDTDGAEVVQLYVGKELSCVTRPVKELKAFKKAYLKAGESLRVEMVIGLYDLAYYNCSFREWMTEPGVYKIYVGSSSRDIRLTSEVKLDCTVPYSMQQLNESTFA